MNILITDYHCASNRGDAAILEGVFQSVESVYPNAEISVMTEYPQAAELVHGIEAVEQTFAGFQWELSKKNVARIYLSLISPLYNRGLTPPGFEIINKRGNLQPYLDADLVISTGGHFLTDVYFPEKVGVLWQHYFLAQLATPVVIYAQTLGPFDRLPYRWLTKRVLDSCELIITRDRKSKNIVQEMGISTPIKFTADAAFSMEKATNREPLLDSLDANDLLPSKGEITVSISVREWQHTDEDYAKAVAETADWLVEEHNANIMFASTCTGLAGYHKDDRLMAAQVVDLMNHGYSERVQILTGEYTPYKLVEIYGQMDLHVGMRMHSNILAMMAKTPIVAIQYQFKTEGLLEMFDLVDYMIDVNEVDTESLQGLIEDALDDRATIANTIQSKLPAIIQDSRRSADLIRENIEIVE